MSVRKSRGPGLSPGIARSNFLLFTFSFFLFTYSASLPAALKDAPPNTWVKVADSGPGPRRSFGLVYVPAEDAFVCFGGSMMMDPKMDPKAADSPYSEMTLNPAKGVWENRFPKGKEGLWGEPTGPSKAPGFAGSYYAFKTKDTEGNLRPYLGAGYYNAMWNWGNCAFDSARGQVVLYWTLANQTAEYDPVARTWQMTASCAELPQDFRDGMLFGPMCYEPINKEIIGCQGGWAYAEGKWRKQELGSPPTNGRRDKVEALRLRARNLAGACRARYYLAESEEEAKAKLEDVAAALARDVSTMADVVQEEGGKGKVSEKDKYDRAAKSLAAASAELGKAGKLLATKVVPEAIHAADAARDELGRAVQALSVQPPARAHARMVYDSKNKKIVLFGGDRLDRLLADTWVYDPTTRRWEQRRPKVSPSPRSGYKMVFLPKSGKVLLIDGYGYKGGGEMWSYDVQANEWWKLAERTAGVPPATTEAGGTPAVRSAGILPARVPAPGRDWYPVPAAANGEDVVVTFFGDSKPEDGKPGLATYAARIATDRVDNEGTAKLGVPPLAEKPYPAAVEDPQWFEKNAPPADPAAEDEWFKKLPGNTWVVRPSPNWPQTDYGRSKCWGTCVLDTDRDQLLHYGGGHATYDGNDVLHYSIRANRYYIGFRPEHTLNFAPNGIGIPSYKSYQDRPYMSGHTYKCYEYDPTLKKLVLCSQKYGDKLYTYDPSAGDWEPNLATPFHKSDLDPNHRETKCVSTPQGVVAWTHTGEGLWRVDAAHMTWEKLPLQSKIRTPGWDNDGLAYDSKRGRILLLSSEQKGDITAYDVKTGQTQALSPAGKERASAQSREAVYLPACDAVLLGARPLTLPSPQRGEGGVRGSGDKPRWLLYDCAKNAWFAVHLPGADPLGKERFNVSLGLMYDPKRELVWAMDILSKPYALRLDLKTADVVPLAEAGTIK